MKAIIEYFETGTKTIKYADGHLFLATLCYPIT